MSREIPNPICPTAGGVVVSQEVIQHYTGSTMIHDVYIQLLK